MNICNANDKNVIWFGDPYGMYSHGVGTATDDPFEGADPT